MEDELSKINYLKIIAENIIRLRGRVSQDSLAKKARISRSTIRAIEEARAISLENLIKIAKALNVSPADLFISGDEFQRITYKSKLLLDLIEKGINLEKIKGG